jgi:murein L,D-transpeptidase YafK
MGLKIKDLPREILEVVKKNAEVSYDGDDTLSSIFTWHDSPEGFSFWSKIDDGDVEHFYTKYPKQKSIVERLIELNTDFNWRTWSSNNSSDAFFMDEFIKEVKVKDPVVVEQTKDYIVDSVIESFKERSKTGIDKYGTTLGRDDLSFLEWLNH